MRWLVLLAIAVLCGCVGTEKDIQREYVCPDGRVVGAADACLQPQAAATTSTTAEQTTTTLEAPSGPSGSSSTTLSAPVTLPDACAGLVKAERATCLAVEAENASLCPVAGLEFRGDFLTASLFDTLGRDIANEGRKDLALDVFSKNETCVMAVLGSLKSQGECADFPLPQLCRERFIVASNDASKCDGIEQGPTQMGCYLALIRLRNNFDACVRYPDYQDCLVRTAAGLGDPTLCQRVYYAKSRGDLVPECVANSRLIMCLQEQDPAEDCCASLPEDKIGECYVGKQRSSNDTIWCARKLDWSGSETDWNCYWMMAKRTMDPRLCDSVPSPDWHDYCIQEMIKATGDTALCERIIDTHKRRRCVYMQD